MKESYVGHLQINVNPQNLAFYHDFYEFLGWSKIYEDPNMGGYGCERGTSVWFTGYANLAANDYDGVGMNHIGIAVSAQADVDQTVAYLHSHGVEPLFETPRHRPEFSAGPDKTYYQVMFASPDRILVEVVYTGEKAG
jgi:catechol 2,3-dioxygenase-like lactoylglutathione lyase family enzyme